MALSGARGVSSLLRLATSAVARRVLIAGQKLSPCVSSKLLVPDGLGKGSIWAPSRSATPLGVLFGRSCQTDALGTELLHNRSVGVADEMTESSARDAKADPKVMKRPHLYRFITELNHRKADAGYSIQSASHMLENHCLQVVWRDGESQAYPYMWLRDNCLCKQCYKPSLNSRTFSFTSLDVEMIPIYALPSDDGKSLRLTWPDGHSGEYPSGQETVAQHT